MIKSIETNTNLISKQYDADLFKVGAIMEAAQREYDINIMECDMKVESENGTSDDLYYLYKEAGKEFTSTMKQAIVKLKDAIIKFFSDMKDKVLSIIRDKKNKDALVEIEKKAKFFPLLGRKKILVENHEEEIKVCDKAIKQLDKIKNKLIAGGDVISEEIDDVKDEFIKAHAKSIAVGAAITVTVAAAIGLAKKMMDDVGDNIKTNESLLLKEFDFIDKQADKMQNPANAQKLLNAYSAIYKYRQEGEVRTLKNLINTIKKSITSFGSTVTSVTKAAKEGVQTESADDFLEDMNVYNYIFEDAEEIIAVDPDSDTWDDVIDNGDDVTIEEPEGDVEVDIDTECGENSINVDALYESIMNGTAKSKTETGPTEAEAKKLSEEADKAAKEGMKTEAAKDIMNKAKNVNNLIKIDDVDENIKNNHNMKSPSMFKAQSAYQKQLSELDSKVKEARSMILGNKDGKDNKTIIAKIKEIKKLEKAVDADLRKQQGKDYGPQFVKKAKKALDAVKQDFKKVLEAFKPSKGNDAITESFIDILIDSYDVIEESEQINTEDALNELLAESDDMDLGDVDADIEKSIDDMKTETDDDLEKIADTADKVDEKQFKTESVVNELMSDMKNLFE